MIKVTVTLNCNSLDYDDAFRLASRMYRRRPFGCQLPCRLTSRMSYVDHLWSLLRSSLRYTIHKQRGHFTSINRLFGTQRRSSSGECQKRYFQSRRGHKYLPVDCLKTSTCAKPHERSSSSASAVFIAYSLSVCQSVYQYKITAHMVIQKTLTLARSVNYYLYSINCANKFHAIS